MEDENISTYRRFIGCDIEVIADEIKKMAQTVARNPFVAFRVKDPETLKKKMALKQTGDVLLINDVYGIRVIVESVEEAYAVLGKVAQEFAGCIGHDYFETPKLVPDVDGKVLRLLQFLARRNGATFEIQITTIECNVVNEELHGAYHRRKYHS